MGYSLHKAFAAARLGVPVGIGSKPGPSGGAATTQNWETRGCQFRADVSNFSQGKQVEAARGKFRFRSAISRQPPRGHSVDATEIELGLRSKG
jgi:hypothetical protein